MLHLLLLCPVFRTDDCHCTTLSVLVESTSTRSTNVPSFRIWCKYIRRHILECDHEGRYAIDLAIVHQLEVESFQIFLDARVPDKISFDKSTEANEVSDPSSANNYLTLFNQELKETGCDPVGPAMRPACDVSRAQVQCEAANEQGVQLSSSESVSKPETHFGIKKG